MWRVGELRYVDVNFVMRPALSALRWYGFEEEPRQFTFITLLILAPLDSIKGSGAKGPKLSVLSNLARHDVHEEMKVPRLMATIAHALKAVRQGDCGVGNLARSLLLAGRGGVLKWL